MEKFVDQPLRGQVSGVFRPTNFNSTLDRMSLRVDRIQIDSLKDKVGVEKSLLFLEHKKDHLSIVPLTKHVNRTLLCMNNSWNLFKAGMMFVS